MSQAYIVVEGPDDAAILKAILPDLSLSNVKFINGQGKYGAESMARKLLMTERMPTVLVIDADTDSPDIIWEHQQDLDFLMRQAAAGIPFKSLLAVPAIEAIFFQERTVLETLIDRQLTDLEWHLAQHNPKELLKTSSGGISGFTQTTLPALADDTIQILRQHPLIQELTTFLSTFSDRGLKVS